MSLLEHRLHLAQVEAVIQIPDDLPAISGDPSQIEQVLLNLVMNATEAQEDRGRVIIRAGVERDEMILEVEDEGSGIEASHLERIFDPFFTTKDEGHGVGLGLSVVYGIVDAHGGNISVQSEVGAGTCFCVRLPLSGPPVQRASESASMPQVST